MNENTFAVDRPHHQGGWRPWGGSVYITADPTPRQVLKGTYYEEQWHLDLSAVIGIGCDSGEPLTGRETTMDNYGPDDLKAVLLENLVDWFCAAGGTNGGTMTRDQISIALGEMMDGANLLTQTVDDEEFRGPIQWVDELPTPQTEAVPTVS